LLGDKEFFGEEIRWSFSMRFDHFMNALPHECCFEYNTDQKSMMGYLKSDDIKFSPMDKSISRFIATADLSLEFGSSEDLFYMLFDAFTLGTEYNGTQSNFDKKCFFKRNANN
jgi:hypothetical protein